MSRLEVEQYRALLRAYHRAVMKVIDADALRHVEAPLRLALLTEVTNVNVALYGQQTGDNDAQQ